MISFVENNVALELIGTDKIITVSLASLRNDFSLGFCRTMYSIQAEIVREKM